MAINPYFNHGYNTVEQDFFEAIVVESIKATGLDVAYLPRTHGIDDVLREPVASLFDRKIVIEAYFHDVANFGGDGTLMSKFGFEQLSSVNLSIAKKAWRDLKVADRLERPREGDLIYLPFSKSMFEVAYVEHEDPFWQLGRYHVFKLSCNMYTRGYNETFTTPDAFINTGGNADNSHEIDSAINDAITTKTGTLVNFDEKNPFGGM